MKEELKQYEVKATGFWESTWMFGDGYDVMEIAESKGWRAIAGWGRDGWDLGSWPYVIVFFRDREGFFDVIVYVEGDVTMYACPTKEIRQAITNETAFFYWKKRDEEWVRAYKSVDELPEELRGPYRRH
jgi:hypothetical protein